MPRFPNFAPRPGRSRFRGLFGGASALALAVAGGAARADVVADGALGSSVSSVGLDSTVTGGTTRAGVHYHGFSEFNVGIGHSVDVQQAIGTDALVSIVRGGASQIDGMVNFTKGGDTAASNVFFLNAEGIIVGKSGVINAGILTLATPTAAELDALSAEALGSGTGAYAKLVAGGTDLAASDIRIYGEINARRLTLRAGARMILDGRITADDPDASGTIAAAVNTEGVPAAGGAEVLAGGVIRLHAGTTMRAGGNAEVRAARGTGGGLIEGQAGEDLTIEASALFDTGATGASNAGSTVLFTEGNAILEPGLRLVARAEAGEGGQFLLTAKGNVDIAGDFDTGSDSGLAGSVVVQAGEADTMFVLGLPTISGGEITVTGDLVTRGGDLALIGADSITLGGNRVSARAVGAGGDPFADLPDRAAGNILLSATAITAGPGAVIDAAGDGDGHGGMVALLAESRIGASVWAVDLPSAEAQIELTDTTLRGGAVTLSARARAGEQLGGPTPDSAREQMDTAETGAQNALLAGDFDDFFDNMVDFVEGLLQRELLDLNDLLPFRVALMEASAEIVVNGGSIRGDGNWKNAGDDPLSTDEAEKFATHGMLSSEGARYNGYGLIRDSIIDIETGLTEGFEAASDSVVIHSHAQTDVTIKPEFTGLGVAVAITDTHSRIRMTDAAVEGSGAGIRIASTAHENLDIALAPGDKRDLAASVIVSVRNLTSQALIDGGSIASADGAVRLQALTGKTHALSNTANAGRDGRAALAVTVSVGDALTELAVNSDITSGSLDLLGETLYFAKTHATESTMGVKEPEAETEEDSEDNEAAKESSKSFVVRIKELLTGGDADETPAPGTPEADRRVGFAFALTTDIALDNDETVVSIGGSYRDLTVDARPVVPFAGTGEIETGDLTAHAGFRFADEDEGGTPLRRDIKAAFGALSDEAQKQLDENNEGKPEDEQQSKDEFLGEFGNALFLSASVASMTGTTRAEIGAQARITAESVDLTASSAFPEADLLATIRSNFDEFMEKTADFNLLDEAPDEDNPEDRPQLRDLLDIIDISSDLTTQADVSALAPAGEDAPAEEGAAQTPEAEDQELAIGVNVNYFNTTHETHAVIRSGAVVQAPDAGTVKIEATTSGMFLHATNLPDKDSFDFDDSVNNAVGGSINFARTARTTVAEIEDGATVEAGVGGTEDAEGGTVTVNADTRIIQAQLAYMGGSGSEVVVNAAIGAGLMEGTTVARIGAGATVTARGALAITAEDSSVNWGSAGAISTSENIGVGASGTVNFVRRTVWAGIGAGPDAPVAAGGAGTIAAGSLDVSASNSALDIAVSVAGAKVAGQPAADPPETPGGGDPAPAEERDEDDDMIIPSWLFDEDENDALAAQNERDTGDLGDGTSTADSEGNTQSTGWAVSGAATVNLMLGNTTTAEVSGASKVRILGAADVTAANSGVGVTLAGAAAAGLSTDQDANALAGSFAIHVDGRSVTARIANTDLEADGAVSLGAEDKANVVNVAVGGAGTSRGDLALAGSVAVAVLTGGVETDVSNATIEGGTVDLSAENESLTVSIAGAVAINMDTSQGYGVGIGIGVNVVTRDALLRVQGTSDIVSAGTVSLTADSKASIYGFGIAGGVGQTGIAGSVSVNVITAGAKLQVTGSAGRKIDLDAGEFSATATETNRIWSLAGAITGGQKSAVGGAITANVIVSPTETALSHVTVRRSAGDLGAVTLAAAADSRIGTLAVAGAVAGEETAVGVGISGNNITAGAVLKLTHSTVTDAASLSATATGSRIIESLGGGVAGSGKNAGGFALTLNLMLGNDTQVVLEIAEISTRADGDIEVEADASGRISSIAAALSASGDTAIGGAATANVTTASTGISATGGSLRAGGKLSLSAEDSSTIQSLAGGVALSGSTGVGAAIAVNVIAHDTSVEVVGAGTSRTLAGTNGISIGANNAAEIESAAVGLAVAGSDAISGSIAVGDIGNSARVSVVEAELDAGDAAVELEATKASEIDILAGAAAGGGSNAVGAAISIAMIHDTVTADLITGQPLTAGSLSVTATGTSRIDALGVAGAAGGSFTLAGSIVAAVIGRPGDLTPTPQTPPNEDDGDPVGDGQKEADRARDVAFDRSNAVFGRDDAPTLDAEDITRARVDLTDAAVVLPDTTIAATETSTIRALAGGVAVGGTTGIGLGLGVNLIFGRVEADLTLPGGTVDAGSVSVTAHQGGSIQAAGISGGGGGTVGGAGSITVNLLDRDVRARVIGTAAGAELTTGGGDAEIEATQEGTIETFAGALAIGGKAGGGGSVLVNIMNDRVAAELQDVRVSTALAAPPGRPLQGAGAFTLTAGQEMTQTSLALAGAGGGAGAFGGSFAVSVASGSVTALMRRATVEASSVTAATEAVTELDGKAGALAVGGAVAAGLGIVTNVAELTVRTDLDGATLRADGNVTLAAEARTTLTGLAAGGSGAGSIGITGTAIGNSAGNTVEVLLRDLSGGRPSDVVARGSVLLRALGTTTVALDAGTDEEPKKDADGVPSINISFAGGGVAGVAGSVSVNTLRNGVAVDVGDDARLVGLGYTAVDAGARLGGLVRGVAIDASASSSIGIVTAGGAVGGTAGVAAMLGFNILDDGADVRLGGEGSSALVNISLPDDSEGPVDGLDLGVSNPQAEQATVIRADVTAEVEAYTLTVAVGGTAGVGAAGSTTLATGVAKIVADRAVIEARDRVEIDAATATEIESYVVGVGGGFVGVSASANVNVLSASALVTLRASRIAAGADGLTGARVAIGTHVQNEVFTLVTGLAAGAAAAGGAVQVNSFDSTSRIRLEGEDTSTSSVTSSGEVRMAAATTMDTETFAASGAAGAVGVGLSANVNLAEATTEVVLADGGQSVTAEGDVELSATETVAIEGLAGAIAVGAAGVGASLDYARFGGSTRVELGDEADVTAGGSLALSATSSRSVASQVVVGSAGTLAAALAISVVEVGARAGATVEAEDGDRDIGAERDEKLADVQAALADDQDSSGSADDPADAKSGTSGLAGYAGGDEDRGTAVTARQGVTVDADTPDVIAVKMGDGVTLSAGSELTADALAQSNVRQEGGGLAIGVVGIASGTVVGNLGTAALVEMGDDVSLSANTRVALSARTEGSGTDGTSLDARAATVVGGLSFAAGVGVAVSRISGTAAVRAGANLRIEGRDSARVGELEVTAERADVVATDVFNLALSGAYGVGLAVVDARSGGVTEIALGRSGAAAGLLAANTLSLGAEDSTRVLASGEGSAGGILAGVNGVVITAINAGTANVALREAGIVATSLAVENTSTARASATARGIAAGAVGVGASVAFARTAMTMTTTVAGTVAADRVEIDTRLHAGGTGVQNSFARAVSTSGGILALNGADARAYMASSLTTEIAGVIAATDRVSIRTRSDDARALSEATGKQGGAVAVGLTMARAGQQSGQQQSVITRIASGYIGAPVLTISSANTQTVRALGESGSGGLFSGAGSETRIDTDTVTRTELASSAALRLFATEMTLGAQHGTTLVSKVDSTSAAAVGASGADSESTGRALVEAIAHGPTTIEAGTLDFTAANAFSRPKDGFNVRSGSGGALDVAAMVSEVTVTPTTLLDIRDGAVIRQLGTDPALAGSFRIGSTTDISLTERQKLDSGGAIAVPVGNALIAVTGNSNRVQIGAAEIAGVGRVEVYAGGDTDLFAEVDTKSYGAAGAASSITRTNYAADNRVVLGDRAEIASLGDIVLKAGHLATRAQDVKLRAESRVFNKTAFPINIPPDADALANTRSLVEVGSGARVVAVQDVYIFGEGGNRSIVGYGRGKDLYREVAAAVGTFFSNLVGGDDVSLDIETGTSSDIRDDGILVDGYVRAGSRNKQVLILGAENEVITTSFGIPEDWSLGEDDFTILRDEPVASLLLERKTELEGFLANPELNTNAAARVAWEAEIEQIDRRLTAPGATGTTDVIVLDDIRAVEGNIYLRGAFVQGAATGTLEAPGDALIRVETYSGAFLTVNDVTIPDIEGGRILFNDVPVVSTAQIRALSTPPPLRLLGPSAFATITGADGDPPAIEIATFVPAGVASGGTVTVDGNISNVRGAVSIVSNYGDLDVRGDVSGLTIDLRVPRGDFILGFKPGVRNLPDVPEVQYRTYFEDVQETVQFRVLSLADGGSVALAPGQRVIPFPFSPRVPSFTLRPAVGQVRAGKNVYITADFLNINGLIQAGTGAYTVDIREGIETQLAGLRASATEERVLLYDPATPVTPLVVRSPHITSDVRVFYNTVNDQIEIEPMVVQGGNVEIVGNIISTGGGRIQSLDGFGAVEVTSEATTPILINRIDLGPFELIDGLPEGLKGTVRITDTGRQIGGTDEDPIFRITEFRRLGGNVEVFDNTVTSEVVTTVLGEGEDAARIDRVVPTTLVSSVAGRDASYAPVANRDYMLVSAEEVVQRTRVREKEKFILFFSAGSDKTKKEVSRSTTVLTPIASPLAQAPAVVPSLGGAVYDYRVVGRKVTSSFRSGESSKREVDRLITLAYNTFTYEWTDTTTSLLQYEHRLRADFPIAVEFGGRESGLLSVESRGDVIFGNTVLNRVGPTTLTSTEGALLTGGSQAVLNVGDATLSALEGSIGGLDGVFRMNQTEGAILNASARDAIAIRELSGDMRIGTIRTTATPGAGTLRIGAVSLEAEGSILPAAAGSIVEAGDIALRAATGRIGTIDDAPLRVDSRGTGRLSARATGDVAIIETAGNMRLDSVISDLGAVLLQVPTGAMLDRNDIETADIRTEEQLVDLWTTDLGLTPETSGARVAEQLEALRQERIRAYDLYWRDRDAAGGAPIAFSLPADTAAALLAGGWTEAQLDAYVAGRQALYAEWNAQPARDPAFDAPIAADDPAALAVLNGATWTAEELTRSLRDGLVRETADTRIRIEDPNVTAAGDITLLARDGIGELLAPYEIAGGTDLTADDLRVLSSAQREDITLDIPGDRVLVRQQEDLNFAFTRLTPEGEAEGRLRVITDTRDIFLAADTAATLAEVDAPEGVDLRIDGAMRDDRTGVVALRGRAVVLESGNEAAIGTEAAPLTVALLDGGRITARGGTGVFLDFPTGGAALNEVFSPAAVNISALGAITDFVGTETARIVGGDITLRGASIGTPARDLGIRLGDPETGAVRLTTTVGDAHLRSYDDLPLESVRLAGGGEIVSPGALRFTGTDTVEFGTAATLRFTAPRGIDLSDAGGDTDIAGGTVVFLTGGSVGTPDRPLRSRIAGLSLSSPGDAPTPVVLREADDLVIGTIAQNDHPDSLTDVVALGSLSAGTILSDALVMLQAAAITDGRIMADRTVLAAAGAIGALSPLDVTTRRFRAETTNGDADLLLRDRAVEVETIAIGGAGALRLALRGADMTLLPGAGIRTAGGPLTITAGALPVPVGVTLLADVASGGGDLTLDIAGSLTAGADILSGGGDLLVDVGADATLTGQIVSGGGMLTLTAVGLLNHVGDMLSAGGDLTVGAATDATLTGLIDSGGGALSLTVAGALARLGETRSGGGDLTAVVGAGALVQGDMRSGGGVLAFAVGSGLDMTGTLASAGGVLALTVGGDTDFSGDMLSGSGDLTADLGGDATLTGLMDSDGGALSLTVAGALARFGDTRSGGGMLVIDAGDDALLDGDVFSAGGDLMLSALGDVVQAAGTRIASATGRLSAASGGDFTIARIESENATDAALALTVGGTLQLAAGQTGANLLADASGAVTTLRLGAMDMRGPLGLQTRIAELDLLTEEGPSHINEETGLIIASAVSRNGLIDIFTSGETVVRNLASDSGAPIVVSALGDLRADAASLAGGDIRLFAFEGSLLGETGAFFQGDTADGVTAFLLARDDLRYRETAGDLRVGFALAELGELEIEAPDGALTLGIMGAGGNLALSGAGAVEVNVIGKAEVDLADVLALDLVRPDRYGRRTAASPGTARLTATGAEGRLFVGLVTARDRVELLADRIDAVAADATPADGLRMVLAHPSESMTSRVDVMVIGDGEALFFEDPFADVRPRLAGRELAEGTMTLEFARIGEGEVNHGGTRLEGEDVVIGGDTFFRQRSFSMFAHTEYRPLSTIDDVQVLAIPAGEIVFDMEREIAVNTDRVLVLNRRLGGVELQGGQGFFFGVGVETEIRSNTFVRGTTPGGVINFLFNDPPDGLDPVEIDEDGAITLPLVLAARQ